MQIVRILSEAASPCSGLHLPRDRRGTRPCQRDELVLEREPHEVLPRDDPLNLVRAVRHHEVPEAQAPVEFRYIITQPDIMKLR